MVFPGQLLGFEQARRPADLIETFFLCGWLPVGDVPIDPSLEVLEAYRLVGGQCLLREKKAK